MVQVNGCDQPSTTPLFRAGYTNLCGLPATAVPLGLCDAGLPIGVQVSGPVFDDPVCLRFARWLEAEYRAFVPPPMAVAGRNTMLAPLHCRPRQTRQGRCPMRIRIRSNRSRIDMRQRLRPAQS
jgi:hypothetical protein